MRVEDTGSLLALIRAGDFATALPLALRLANDDPNDASRLAMLGHVQRRSGDLDSAIATLQSATRVHAGIPAAWFDLASALLDSARYHDADAAAQQHLRLAPQSAEAHYLRFRTLSACSAQDAADQAFRSALAHDPKLSARRLRLANACFDGGDHDGATWHFRRLRELRPELVTAWTGEIASLMRRGMLEEADAVIAAALTEHPNNLTWLRGNVEIAVKRGSSAANLLPRLARWRAQAPHDPAAASGEIALLCAEQRFSEALAILDAFAAANHQAVMPRWASMQLPNSPVFSDDSEIDRYIDQFDQGLSYFEAQDRYTTASDGDIAHTLLAVQNFYLAYTGRATSDLDRRYAAQVSRMTSRWAPASVPKPSSIRPFRIAVVSAHFHVHSVSRVMRDLICELPNDEFELHGCQIGQIEDASTQTWRRRCSTFESGHRTIPEWCQALRRCGPDAVLFLDIGMESLTQALASIRHARVQLTTWGHPVSSGLPTIDYFISSDLCEPDDADGHYNETLWRLPGLANAYTFLPAADQPLGPHIGRSAPRLSCPQSGLKLTPDHDALFRDILAAVPDATLDLVTQLPPGTEVQLKRRMAKNMPAAEFGRIRFNPSLPYADYIRLVRESDVLIDTMHWSGGLTSMDALHLGVPVVTLPGRLMRGRQTFGMLRALDVPALIAASRDDLVQRVANLCLDRKSRCDISAAILERRERLVGCEDAVQDLARRLRDALN